MNPRFETINGTLCIMLEKPDAINEFSKTPCVIASKYGSLKKYFILDFPTSNPSMSMLAEGFEILGYPVEEGSHWWALWQMQQGKKVCHPTLHPDCGHEYIKMNNGINVDGSYYGELDTIFNADNSIYCDVDDFCHASTPYPKSGWQLYEPKPPKEPEYVTCTKCGGTGHEIKEVSVKPPDKHLLSDAKTGDKVRLRNGEIHILEIRKNTSALGHDYWAGDIQRSHDIDGCYLCSKEEHPLDIVELLSELKVGDWVRSDEGDGVIEDTPLTMPDVRMTDGKLLPFHAEDLKVIKPSEVMIDFGSGIKGRIHYDKESWGFVVLDEHNDWIAQIDPDNLSEPKKSLVEKLLEAQEG